MIPRGIIVHTAADPDDADSNMEALRRYHVEEKEYDDVAYHRGYTKKGARQDGRALNVHGAHCRGANDTIGIVAFGHGDMSDFTPAQQQAMAFDCAAWCVQYGWTVDQVRGHRECEYFGAPKTYKSCPGKLVDMDRFRENVAYEIKIIRRPVSPITTLTDDDLIAVLGNKTIDDLGPNLTDRELAAVAEFHRRKMPLDSQTEIIMHEVARRLGAA